MITGQELSSVEYDLSKPIVLNESVVISIISISFFGPVTVNSTLDDSFSFSTKASDLIIAPK